MPYLAVAIPVGTFGDNYDPDMRVGGFLGFHIGSMVSLNLEGSLELMGKKNKPRDYSGIFFELAASPFFHVELGRIELIAGPKLGYFLSSESHMETSTASDSGQGYTYGANLGVLAAVGERVAIGGMASFTNRSYSEFCQTHSIGGTKYCSDTYDRQTLSLSAVFMF
jgi:hypothetical protein